MDEVLGFSAFREEWREATQHDVEHHANRPEGSFELSFFIDQRGSRVVGGWGIVVEGVWGGWGLRFQVSGFGLRRRHSEILDRIRCRCGAVPTHRK